MLRGSASPLDGMSSGRTVSVASYTPSVCSGAVRWRPGGGLFDGGGGKPTGWQQHLGELHRHQQHRGEWHWRGNHVSRTSYLCPRFWTVQILWGYRHPGWNRWTLSRSGENDVDFIGNLEAEEGELSDDLVGATGRVLLFLPFCVFVQLRVYDQVALSRTRPLKNRCLF